MWNGLVTKKHVHKADYSSSCPSSCIKISFHKAFYYLSIYYLLCNSIITDTGFGFVIFVKNFQFLNNYVPAGILVDVIWLVITTQICSRMLFIFHLIVVTVILWWIGQWRGRVIHFRRVINFSLNFVLSTFWFAFVWMCLFTIMHESVWSLLSFKLMYVVSQRFSTPRCSVWLWDSYVLVYLVWVSSS